MVFTEKNPPHPHEVFHDSKFITIAVPTYMRPFYLKKLLDTLQEHADMPYEVIVGDDGSPDQAARDEVYKMRDRISLTIFNNSYNAGLCVAANRVISLASSRYILFMNDDCFFTKPCLKDICNVLSKPYVGVVSPCNDTGTLSNSDGVCSPNGTRFAMSNFLGGGSAMAFRKDVWKEVGGWDDRCTSGQSDNVFFFKILKAGYWKVLMEGPERVKVGNFVYGSDYHPTAGYMKGNDCSFPRIFPLTNEQQIYINQWHRVACQYWVDGERTIPNRHTYDTRQNPVAGLNDIPYWGQYFLDIFGGNHSSAATKINWDIASRHGQSKWKEHICKDFNLGQS